MKRLFLMLTLLILGVVSYGYSEVIFQDDFESDPSSWECTDGQLSKWSVGWLCCGSTVGFGPEWKMGAGHNSQNAVEAWKHSVVPNDYRAESKRWFTGSEVKTEIYHRWYMKWPPSMNKDIISGLKMWRYILKPNGYSNPPEIYLNLRGTTIADGNLVIYSVPTSYLTLGSVSDFNDGQWHCLELRIKLNSNDQEDGVIQYWLDGVEQCNHTGLKFSQTSFESSITDIGIHRMAVGLGNNSDSPWFMSEWTAVSFDDVVLATEYIGPLDAEPTYDSPTITAPSDFSTTSSSVEIEGAYGVDPDLADQSVVVTWTLGESSGFCVAALGVFSCTVPVELGANSIVFRVVDSNNGEYEDTTVITRTAPPSGNATYTGSMSGGTYR